jgi:hypothetical protein
MRNVFIALAVLALAGTAFFAYSAAKQHGNADQAADIAAGHVAELERIANDTNLESEHRQQDAERESMGVRSAIESIRFYKDERNTCLGLGAGTLALAAVFVALARRKGKGMVAAIQ